MNDVFFMREALKLAEKAADVGEVPVGAVVVKTNEKQGFSDPDSDMKEETNVKDTLDYSGRIVGRGFNMRETNRNSVHHAEILAIEDACKALGGWRLQGCVLYVTLEPCPMCAGAIINSRLDRVVYGAKDLKAGSCGSIVNLFDLPYNHKPEITVGIIKNECEEIMSKFFKKLRDKEKDGIMKLIPAVTDEQIKNVSELADLIWHEFFPSVISGGQIDFMIDKFQSVPAITEQIRNLGYNYYIMHKNGGYIGYCAVNPQNNGRLFLSKLYIKKEFRGQGYARKTFMFLKDFCINNNFRRIWLTVNKNNTQTIEVYKKLGFRITGEGVTDIGGGYVMDDYYMELELRQ